MQESEIPRLPVDLVALTWHEATLLRLALASLSQLGSTPFKPKCESLLAKVQGQW